MSDLHKRDNRAFLPTYTRLPLDITRGEGVYLYDRDGRRFLDMVAGLAVNALGHRHPAVLEAVRTQIDRYLHLSNAFVADVQVEFAERLLGASGFDRCFLCNSGTEAMEAAIKLCRKWGRGSGKRIITGFSDSFHGRTLGALSITGREKYREGLEPLLPDTSLIPFNALERLHAHVGSETLAVVLETIQGEAGIRAITPEFAAALSALHRRFGFLLIADETQSGIGRTGKLFAFEHFGLSPDLVVTAKAIGGGLPLGALLAREVLSSALPAGSHGSTFGGNPLSCAAGIAVLREVVENGLTANAALTGALLKRELEAVAREFPGVVADVRGEGLMLGLEMRGDAGPFSSALLERGVIVNVTNGSVLRWLPPLIIGTSEVGIVAGALREALGALSG